MPKHQPPKNTVTTTIALDRDTYKQLRYLAVDEDSNVRDLIRTAVAEYLERRSRRKGKGGKTS